MKRFSAAVVIAAVMFAPQLAHAGTAPCLGSVNPFANTPQATAAVCVNGQFFYWTSFTGTGKPFTLAPQMINLGSASFTLSAAYNNDPFVSFTFTSIVTAAFGVANFDVYFNTPVIGGGYNHASSSGTMNVTANGVLASGGVLNSAYPAYISGYANNANLNVNTGSGPCGATNTGQVTTTTVNCNPAGASTNFAPISPNILSSRLSYVQSTANGSSTAAWTGIVSLTTTTVPEPATISLLFVGLLAVGGVRMKRNRN